MPEDEPDRTQWILSNCSKRPQPVKTKTSTVNTEVVATYRQETDNLEYSRGREIPNDPYERLVFWRADEAETKAAEAKVRLDRTRGRLIETKVVHGLMKRYTSTAIQILEHVATEVATQFPDPPELERQIERAISDRVNGAAMAIAKLWDDIIKEFDAG